MSEEIHYKYVKVKDLPALAEENIRGAEAGKFIPITRQRAAAMAANPYADPDDVGMTVAYKGDELVGYFGIMPILLKYGDQTSKVHFFSTWNVSPTVRGMGVGSQLMTESLKLGLDFMIVGSIYARRVSEKHNFIKMHTLKINTIDFKSIWRFNPVTLFMRALRKTANLLGRKLDIEKTTRRVEGWFHKVYGRLFKRNNYPLLTGSFRKQLEGIEIKKVARVRDEIPAGVPPKEVHLHRGPQIVNWMLEKPWVVLPGQSDTVNLNFYFSDVRPIFENIVYEIHKQDKYLGYVVYQFSQIGKAKVLKILDVLMPNSNLVLPLALKLGQEKEADEIIMNTTFAQDMKRNLLGRLLLVGRERIYQISPRTEDSPLAKHWQEIELDYCDGDMAFS